MIPEPMMAMVAHNEQTWWDAVLAKDAAQDGAFYYAVSSTGVYCRPSCPSRRPLRRNVIFFLRPEDAERAGFRACLRCHPRDSATPQLRKVQEVCRFIEDHLDEPLTLNALSRRFRLSPFHLQRTFRATLGVTPREYADTCRLQALKTGLKRRDSVTSAMYDAGYGSSSRLYERTASQLGMTPGTYRDGGKGSRIFFTTADSPLGKMLVGATEKGICCIRFGDSENLLVQALKREYPNATIASDDNKLGAWVEQLLTHLRGEELHPRLPLDIQATAFQRRVWEYLQSIPYGKTASYSDVARALGDPNATRAVARACATNPVAIAIPCHRVVRKTGDLGGYRWGLKRKRALLDFEHTRAAEQQEKRP
jgi:AraC family transcriptional regulator, regulatory protein of adaptative response / methylated-DNA-[protein]-cysteine methyltransferase